MTSIEPAGGRRRRVLVPPPTVPVPAAPPADPPIYRELVRVWSDRGRTLPGRHDPEWVRLAAPFRGLAQFSGSRDPRRDGR
ncbi:hypothetical protein E0E62_30320 [Streptomyces sp. 16-176A]|jgi:hypothetical protein|nr:hypothetical protein [Streptomyces sp. GMY02]